jgi:hypothetical protein
MLGIGDERGFSLLGVQMKQGEDGSVYGGYHHTNEKHSADSKLRGGEKHNFNYV